MPPALIAENLGKQFQLGARAEPYLTIREQITSMFSGRSRTEPGEILWALKDVSFEVSVGAVVGIIGNNGAGKSTLLKIISRISPPTTGTLKLFGKVGSLLEVGTGFHPELSGRENIYLNGAILGMSRREIDSKFAGIVEFAEVERFLDTPVKRYSSGMYIRLAFAVAAHLEPETLVVDEVLAVGDAAFQRKCLGKMDQVARQGRTVLLVSHNMGAIRGLCHRVLWLEGGRLKRDGEPQKVVAEYLDSTRDGFKVRSESPSGDFSIERVVLRDGSGTPTTNMPYGSDVRVDVHYDARSPVELPYFWIAVASQHGSLFGANMLLDGLRPERLEGRGLLSCTFRAPKLLPQVYTVSLGVRDGTGAANLIPSTEVGFFNVMGNALDLGLPGELADTLTWSSTPLLLPYDWQLSDGRVLSFVPRDEMRPNAHVSE